MKSSHEGCRRAYVVGVTRIDPWGREKALVAKTVGKKEDGLTCYIGRPTRAPSECGASKRRLKGKGGGIIAQRRKAELSPLNEETSAALAGGTQ